MRYHLILARMAIIKKSTDNKCWRGCEEKEMLLHCWWECKLIQPLWKMVWRFLKKLGIKPPYDSTIPLLGIYPEETEIEKTHVSHCSLKHYLQQVEYGSQRRQWHPTPVLLPGESHGQRSLVGCSSWGREESDMTEATQQQQNMEVTQMSIDR